MILTSKISPMICKAINSGYTETDNKADIERYTVISGAKSIAAEKYLSESMPFAEFTKKVTIKDISEIRTAAIALQELCDLLGLRTATCVDIASKEPMVDADGAIINAEIFGWLADGERWWEDTRLALSSPLPRACRYESDVFWANEQGIYSCYHNEYLDEIALNDFERRALTKAAIVVPVHMPFGQIGAVSFMSKDRAISDLSDVFEEHADFLATVARRFTCSYVAVLRKKRRIPADCMLSKREVECLHWAAIGKTDKEISMILERSHATVRYHVHRAGEKLNSVNRSQTIFKAGQLGYLGASE
jgi:DNA-binding CsgD family transcriptional regulator